MLAAICRGAHQIRGLLAKPIAAQRHIVAVAERLPLRLYGASREGYAEAENRKRAAHLESPSQGQQRGRSDGSSI